MSRLFLLLPAFIFIASCATTGSYSREASAIPEMVWPPPPAKPRIKLVQLFEGPEDLGLNQSFLERLKSWFAGSENLRMIRPYSVAAHSDRIVVADPDSASVHLFDLKQRKYQQIRQAGDEVLQVPIAVSISAENIYVADSKMARVFIFDTDLALVNSLDGFDRPTSLAFDPERKTLYVTDTLAHSISVFSSSGELISKIGQRGEGKGQFNYPSHLAYSDNRIVVNDTMNFRLKLFNHEGKHLNTFGKQGNAIGAIGQSKGVAVDPDGHIYVADALAGRIQVFDQNGIFLLDFGQHGSEPGRFQLPAGLTFWEDKLYVADAHNGRIQVFRYLGEEN